MSTPSNAIAALQTDAHNRALGIIEEPVVHRTSSWDLPWGFLTGAVAATALLLWLNPSTQSPSIQAPAQLLQPNPNPNLNPNPPALEPPAPVENPIVIPSPSTSPEHDLVSLLDVEPPLTREERIAERRDIRIQNLPLHAAPPPLEGEPSRGDNLVGVYLTPNSVRREDFLRETIDNLVEAGGTALIFDVKGSRVHFHSAAPIATEKDLVVPQYELPAIIHLAHEHGLQAVGRYVAIKDYGITERMPSTRVADLKTGRVLSPNWIDPSNPDAIEYNMQIICELAASGIDEINLDYIRFSTAEVGALRAFSREEKADRVEVFVRAARETIDRCGPATRLGLSTYAILGWNYELNVATLGQDVVRFAPLVDIISPMAYPSTFTSTGYYVPERDPGPRSYYLVYRTLTGYRELLGPEHTHKLRPWIQGYGMSARDIGHEIRAVKDAGLCGYAVWNADNAYDPAYAAVKTTGGPRDLCSD